MAERFIHHAPWEHRLPLKLCNSSGIRGAFSGEIATTTHSAPHPFTLKPWYGMLELRSMFPALPTDRALACLVIWS